MQINYSKYYNKKIKKGDHSIRVISLNLFYDSVAPQDIFWLNDVVIGDLVIAPDDLLIVIKICE